MRNSHCWQKKTPLRKRNTQKEKKIAVRKLEMKKKKLMDDTLQELSNLENEIPDLKQSKFSILII